MLFPSLQREGARFYLLRNIISVQHSGSVPGPSQNQLIAIFCCSGMFFPHLQCQTKHNSCWKCKTTTKNSLKVEQCSEG